MKLNLIENDRLLLQRRLDIEKTQLERNKLGQFSTPSKLAHEILGYAQNLIDKDSKVSFLDPAIGTGSFYNALITTFCNARIEKATGYEIDPHYARPAQQLWNDTILDIKIQDFTLQPAPVDDDDKYNLIICNPPYVRHQHLNENKKRLSETAFQASNIQLSGLAGLYCYFICIAHKWMKNNGVAGWLVPSEFMDVNYGTAIKKYLLEEVTLLHIHRFDPNDLQFGDALVSSAIVWFKNQKPVQKQNVIFSYGGSLSNPMISKGISLNTLLGEHKWSRFPIAEPRSSNKKITLGDFFTIKRGIATGNNKYFILSKEQIEEKALPLSQFKPILPSPRDLTTTEVKADRNGKPILDKQLFVLDSQLTLDEIRVQFPQLYNYLDQGIDKKVPESYLCKTRKIWYKQDERKPAPFYCSYIGRVNSPNKNPFKFILNKSQAIATNSYLFLFPKENILKIIEKDPNILDQIKLFLDSISMGDMLEEGRVYGGGMYKMEPRELAKVSAVELNLLLNK